MKKTKKNKQTYVYPHKERLNWCSFFGAILCPYIMYVYYVRMLLCTVGLKGFAWISIFDNFVYSSIMIIDISQNKTE